MTTDKGWTRRSAAMAGATLLAGGLSGAGSALAGEPIVEEEGYLPVAGGRIYWRRFGRVGKTPLLALHGGPGAAHNYLLSMKALADERPVILYDQLGCGRADAPTNEGLYTIQRSVDELEAVRTALGLEKVILYGHSWGTILAIEYLCQGRGTGVEKLILGGALASVPQAVAGMARLIDGMPGDYAEKLRALEREGRTATPEYAALAQKFYDNFVIRTPPSPDALASIDALSKSIAYRVMNGPNEFSISGVIKDWDRRKDLGTITNKTLITTGEFDEITLDCHETIRDGLGGPSSLVTMSGCSHLTMCERPEAYNALLRGFLNET